jgi:hypothetical protein
MSYVVRPEQIQSQHKENSMKFLGFEIDAYPSTQDALARIESVAQATGTSLRLSQKSPTEYGILASCDAWDETIGSVSVGNGNQEITFATDFAIAPDGSLVSSLGSLPPRKVSLAFSDPDGYGSSEAAGTDPDEAARHSADDMASIEQSLPQIAAVIALAGGIQKAAPLIASAGK